MAPPLSDGAVTYETGVEDDPATADVHESRPATTRRSSRDVSAFLMWVAEPHLVARKETGFQVIAFLILFAGLMWFVKNRLWKGIEH